MKDNTMYLKNRIIKISETQKPMYDKFFNSFDVE